MLRRRRAPERRPDASVRWMVPAEEPGADRAEPASEPAVDPTVQPTGEAVVEAVEQPTGEAVVEPVEQAGGESAVEPPPEDMSPEALRARLAARGLLRTEPSVRIREVAPGQPRPAPAPAVEPSWSEPAPETEDVGADAEALEPEPEGPRAPVRCPTCRQVASVAVAATGFSCPNCGRVWRWAVCSGCKELALTVARQESWRCGACGHLNRSWWRTETAARDRVQVQERRQEEAARRERERVLALARRRRWKIIVAGLLLVLATAAGAVVVTVGGSSSPAEHSRAACNRFERLRTQIANGTLRGAEVDAEIGELRQLATEAEPEVAAAAAQLAAAGRPGTARFLIASTEMADACAGP